MCNSGAHAPCNAGEPGYDSSARQTRSSGAAVLPSSKCSVSSLSSSMLCFSSDGCSAPVPQNKKAPAGHYHWAADLEKLSKNVQYFHQKIDEFEREEWRAFEAASPKLEAASPKRQDSGQGKAAAFDEGAADDYVCNLLARSPSPRGNRTPRDDDDPFKNCTHNEPDT